MTITEFTPLASTLGGALIGISAVMLMLFNGRIAGRPMGEDEHE